MRVKSGVDRLFFLFYLSPSRRLKKLPVDMSSMLCYAVRLRACVWRS